MLPSRRRSHFLLTAGLAVLTSGTIAAQERVAGAEPQELLWDSAMQGDTAAMGLALARGALVDSLDLRRSRNGRRALNWAAWYNQPAAVRFLTTHGADINSNNLTGFTPLHHAAENGSLEAAQALLAAGADASALNYLGQTPGDVARATGHPEIAALIEASHH